MSVIEHLEYIRSAGGKRHTQGLPDEAICRFATSDPDMADAVGAAREQFDLLQAEFPELMALDEMDQVAAIEAGFVNFYADDTVNPYVSLAARGPWIVTTKGAVLHDNGGYGMLGFGHVPVPVIEAMSRPQVMANVMTPSFSQYRLIEALKREIGRNRAGGCPFPRFLAMNSGSESVSVASRIVDVNAKLMTDPGGRHDGKRVKKLSLKGGFHGRTGRPAQWSDSTRGSYNKHLATFRGAEDLITVEPNDVATLEHSSRIDTTMDSHTRLPQRALLSVRFAAARSLPHAAENHAGVAHDRRIARVYGVQSCHVIRRQEHCLNAESGEKRNELVVFFHGAREVRSSGVLQRLPLGRDGLVVHKRVTRVLEDHRLQHAHL